MEERACFSCGRGLSNVTIESEERVGEYVATVRYRNVPHCVCGETLLTLDQLAKVERLFALAALQDGQRSPFWFRYARKAAGRSRQACAAALGLDVERVKAMEEGREALDARAWPQLQTWLATQESFPWPERDVEVLAFRRAAPSSSV